MKFTDEQIKRYSRHIILPDVGGKGQEKLLRSKVLVIGTGGLGSPASMYLAAAGVGTIGVVDHDVVDLSNLQRQILHLTADVGKPKTASAKRTLESMNPDVKVIAHQEKLSRDNIRNIIKDYEIILDCTDNFSTRYLINDACYLEKKILVSASMFRYDGQLTIFDQTPASPCYRCLYPEPPPPGAVPSCQEAGILGVLAGTMGTLQATETIKQILGIGRSLAGRLLLYNAQQLTLQEVKIKKDPKCSLCGVNPTVTELIDYEEFCGVGPAR
ncbi:MAG TPA: molybdopterin-synthase adenylyltransferase MoeB [bacterium]